jgi:hypothetical protein
MMRASDMLACRWALTHNARYARQRIMCRADIDIPCNKQSLRRMRTMFVLNPDLETLKY